MNKPRWLKTTSCHCQHLYTKFYPSLAEAACGRIDSNAELKPSPDAKECSLCVRGVK